ncbi:helix-turn-helix domain-containing protein [Rhizobium laguerreae]|jgi:transcriptional regulator GlxA family with amidase domain|uniref:AraC family transcriptional regulator with amidase-like domain n=1 Tax=Rhizobium laguerreae TaxID=1076926 RepID=A0A1S9GZ86_9HYPH|nr:MULTISPECIES: helix-turn-helix domain-containing protein [Rhizobium]MBB3164004.1 transcriptional regulator GlxA family with amidase domain [Rhizobium laguerreae]MBN9984554.1 helix-turn-helix domain-containing protein [Rhizobium laguerreae]MBY3065936.1 helix-turn-helix domain-containing protein [Rhizobium laguerreae]MBY3073009.1 helix-turn-helix domain-containing protein [Rhizobium laguerreae]MBY3078958.1 helix-turn-helix domain-containing protein [Rhizobium laguerreae]
MTDAAQPFDIPVFVVVPPRVLLLDVAGPIEVLRKANLEQRTVRFTVTYIGPSATVGSSIGLAVTGVAALPERLPDNALVVVAGSADAPMETNRPWDEQERADQAAIVAWLKRAILPGIRLISICSGALLAAEAGMLDGRDCTTHHACIEDLARLAPTARVRDNRLYVEDGDRLTSAGITAGIDLMLHIVAEAAGHACALAVARYLVVYLRRGGSDPQLSPWLEGRNHIHPVIHRAQDAVAANPSEDWSVASLARLSGASPRNLSRLFNEQTGMSVTDFVNLMRVALAREMLAGSRLDMEAVAMRAGFGSARQLRRAWNRLNDGPPSAARARLSTGS